MGPMLGAAWARMPERLSGSGVSIYRLMCAAWRPTEIEASIRGVGVRPRLVEVIEADVGVGDDGISLFEFVSTLNPRRILPKR